MNKKFNTWVVYFNPKDYPPNTFVVRRFENEIPTMDKFASKDKEECVKWLKKNAEKHEQGQPVKLMRDPKDIKEIVEIWV